MNCPTCQIRAYRLGGGYTKSHAYYECQNEDCETVKFSVNGHVVKILGDEPEQTFKNVREALRVLRQAVRDDRDWFDAVTDETIELSRMVAGMLRRA